MGVLKAVSTCSVRWMTCVVVKSWKKKSNQPVSKSIKRDLDDKPAILQHQSSTKRRKQSWTSRFSLLSSLLDYNHTMNIKVRERYEKLRSCARTLW